MDLSPTGQRFSGYMDFLRAEADEIARLKWLESERLGRDCGADYATWTWCMRHRTTWISGLKAEGRYPA